MKRLISPTARRGLLMLCALAAVMATSSCIFVDHCHSWHHFFDACAEIVHCR